MKAISLITIISTLLFGLPVVAETPKREVRAVWLTTFGGLDWPNNYAQSSKSIERQQRDLCQLLDKLQAIHINTILFQTRIRATVTYPSRYEPWDGCLSGHPGISPGYDPLAFIIAEGHKRGMEIHAWVVAFPACNLATARLLGKQAPWVRRPDLFKRTGDHWMMDPGVPESAHYLANICHEIAKNYDIDGIHLDYIRYPEKEIPFNDALTFKRYGKGKNKQDWRRENITRCVQEIYRAVKEEKPWVRISSAPIGKQEDLSRYSSWGWNAYYTANQDAQGWLKQGIMDMLFPMMYFDGDHFYPFLFDWKEHSTGRPIIPGLGIYFLSEKEKDWPLDVIRRETTVSRENELGGQSYFRTRFLVDNVKGIYSYLQQELYPYPSLTPAITWQDSVAPAPPKETRLFRSGSILTLTWKAPNTEKEGGIFYNIYRSKTFPVDITKPENLFQVRLTGTTTSFSPAYIPYRSYYYAITSMDRYGNESTPVAFNVMRQGYFSSGFRVERDTLFLPDIQSEYVLFTDITGRTYQVTKPNRTINVEKLPSGFYVIRTLNEKGVSHRIGNFLK